MGVDLPRLPVGWRSLCHPAPYLRCSSSLDGHQPAAPRSASSLAGTNGTLGRAPAHPYPARTHRARTARAPLGLGVASPLPRAPSVVTVNPMAFAMGRRPASSFEYLGLERRTPVCASPSRPPSSRACGPRCARPASPSTVRRPSLVRPRCIRPTYATHVSKTSTRSASQCRLVRDCSRVRRTVRFTSPGPLRRPSFRRTECFRLAAPVVPPRALSSDAATRPPARL